MLDWRAVTSAPAPLILTGALDPASFAVLDELRRAHFPPERNHLRAHLTLFHHLPGEEIARVRDDLAAVAASQPPCPFEVARVVRFGAGVGYALEAPALVALRAGLAERWGPWLTRQDQRPLRPHVTVQNKVASPVAEALFTRLAASFAPWPGAVDALELWHYEGGPWRPAGRWALRGAGAGSGGDGAGA